MPNGELLTATGRVRLVPAEVSSAFVREGWVASDEQMRFRVVALDLDGKPLARQPVSRRRSTARRATRIASG